MRFFIGKDPGLIIREKLAFSGSNAQIDALIVAWLTVHSGWTIQEVDITVFTASDVVLDQLPLRSAAINFLLTDQSPLAKEIRAVLLVILDELNILRTRDRDRSVDVAAATTLADLKTRWAARSSLDDRTAAQGKTAVQNKLDGGSSD